MNDDVLQQIMARLEAIERRLGMGREAPAGGDGPGRQGLGGGFRPGPQEDGGYLRGQAPERRDEPEQGGCRFNEKHTVDVIVQLVTDRLEEVLRVLPQVIQIPPGPPPPPRGPAGDDRRS